MSIFRPNTLKSWFLLICWILVSGNACEKDADLIPAAERRQSFSGAFAAGKVTADELTEASGLAGGLHNPDIVWAHNDSGDGARIFALNGRGEHVGTYYFQGVNSVDWEDMAAASDPDSGQNFLYIADIGDNLARRPYVTIYRVPEPVLTGHGLLDTIPHVSIVRYFLKYEDGPRDAETFLMDPLSGKAYLVSKERPGAGLYGFVLPPEPKDTLIMSREASLTYSTLTGGDISPDGTEILLKNYQRLFYWHRADEEPLEQLLQRKARRIPYVPEPQGEAIAWKKDGSGFFTLSEELLGIEAVLYWHRRK